MRPLILSLLLAAAGICYPQDVIRVSRPYALLNLDPSSGITPGTVLPVERLLPSGARVQVGTLKVLFYRDTISAARIVNEEQFLSIQAGDRILLTPTARQVQRRAKAGSFAAALKSPLVSYSSAGLGLVSGGLAIFYYNKAAETADTRPDNMQHYLRLTEKVNDYDNRSNIFQAVGAGLLVFSALHYLLVKDSPPAGGETVTYDCTPRDGASFAGLLVTFPLPRRQ